MSHTPEHYSHVLVGTGQATATLIAGLPSEASIAVIEGGDVGGTCVNVGCTPTKTLVASARVAAMAGRAADYGVHAQQVSVDVAAAMRRMDGVRSSSRAGLERFLSTRANVTLLRGWARFVGPRRLAVGERIVEGEHVFLNVGARPVTPAITGLNSVPWLDSASLLDLQTLPEHLVIIGASYVGLEFAQVWRRFGARVTVIEQAPRLLPREDADVAAAIAESLADEGIDLRVGHGVRDVAPVAEGVRVRLRDGTDVDGSTLLVAAGRQPNSDWLDLQLAGVDTDERGYVLVDDRTRTSAAGVYALGDVNGRGAFTHTSVHDAQVVLDLLNGAGASGRRIDERDVVYALFTDPPLGRVGLTEDQVRASGRRVLRAVKPMRSISRAQEMGETIGFAKVIVDADTDRIIGAAVLGVGGDEVVNLFALAMSAGLTTEAFKRSVLVHPTVSELMPWLLAELEPIS